MFVLELVTGADGHHGRRLVAGARQSRRPVLALRARQARVLAHVHRPCSCTSGLLHIAFNMWALWVIGGFVEAAAGRAQVPRHLLRRPGSPAPCSCLVAAPVNTLVVGASGAIFGIFGALAVHAFLNRGRDFQSRALLSNVVFLLVINLVFSFTARGRVLAGARRRPRRRRPDDVRAHARRPQGPARARSTPSTSPPSLAVVAVARGRHLVARDDVRGLSAGRAPRVTPRAVADAPAPAPRPPLVEPGAALVPAAEVAGRLAGLQATLAARGLDAALLVQNADLYYFSGTVQRSYLYVPAAGEATLFVRKLAERARLESPLGARRRRWRARATCRRWSPRATARRRRALGLELDVLPVADFRRLETLVPGGGVRGRRPRHRAPARRQVALGGRAHPRRRGRRPRACTSSIPGILREGLTEAEFAGRVEAEARRLGHEGFIRMRGFNQEMFYGQLLTGASGCGRQLPRHAAGRHRPQRRRSPRA